MPRFTYRAKDSALHLVEGAIDADSEAAAITRLGSQGIFPISIAETGAPSAPTAATVGLTRRVSSNHVIYATRQLADLLGGGLPLLNALTMVAKQVEHPGLRRIFEQVAGGVREGQALSEALTPHPQVFPSLYISMVRAGEATGGLEQALSRLADLGESEAELRSRIISAMAYPAFVLCVAIGMTGFLIGYVIPKLSLVFIESGQLLPLPTRFLLAVSHACTRWWWAALGGVILIVWLVRQWYASPQGKGAMDRLFVSLPGVGTLVRKLDTARFARNLGVMASQGVPVLQALEVTGRNVSNAVLQQAVAKIQEAVREGSSIASALTASGQFPVFVSNMVAVGEESGTLDAALLKVATTYEREVDRVIRTLTTVLEPVMLVLVGGVVMFIVLAMLLPVFQIGMVIQ
ncbi:MAG: type II secretion system F family protein [Candidatus Omnitrophica bacterium]|nr:type II secretion system F family protein [Candidatus Omnitrophota bacterium]